MIMNMSSVSGMATVLATIALPAAAELRLPQVFSDHMVVQRGAEIPVWGWTDKGAQVVVELAGLRAEAVADAAGCWSVRLAPLPAGGPHTLAVTGGDNTVTVSDVLVGEVWLASGQSWMTWAMASVQDAEAEIAAADYPHIRMFNVKWPITAKEPAADLEGEWSLCRPAAVKTWSGVGYFFARHLHRELGVPIGILHSSVPGTTAWAWSDRETLENGDPDTMIWGTPLPRYMEALDRRFHDYAKAYYDSNGEALHAWLAAVEHAQAQGEPLPMPPQIIVGNDPRNYGQHVATLLYNGMIAPLIPYAIRGVIWWQGGAESPDSYRLLFPAMIRGWRRNWGQGDMPFFFVQRPNVEQHVVHSHDIAAFRDAQAAALELPNTGMVVSTDIGRLDDIHPINLQDYGYRLGLLAEGLAYGRNVVWSGPIFKNMTIENGTLRLRFEHIGGGLVTKDDAPVRGFEVAGADGRYVAAQAVIADNGLIVSSHEVPEPVAVRHAWAANPDFNLYNREGLPAWPFQMSVDTTDE